MWLYLADMRHGDLGSEGISLLWYSQLAEIGAQSSPAEQYAVQLEIAALDIGQAPDNYLAVLLSLYCGITETYRIAAQFQAGGHFVVMRHVDGGEWVLRPVGVETASDRMAPELLWPQLVLLSKIDKEKGLI